MSGWFKLAKRANDYAQATADRAFDEHADPKVQLQQAIAALQQHHQELAEAAVHVIAQETQLKMRLSSLSSQEATLTRDATAALATGHQDAARAFALQLSSAREQIKTLAAQIPQAEDAANQARLAVQESADQVQQKMNERGQILAQIDQANMQKQLSASLKAVSDMTNSTDVPSFEAIKSKVQGQYAEAQAATDLQSHDPTVLEMHAHHDQMNAEADAILSQLQTGNLSPAALEATTGDIPSALGTRGR